MGKVDLEKIKEFLRNKRNIKIFVWIISIIILLLIIWLIVSIYTQDKPKIVPEETRGAIREGIKENIGEPIKSVNETIGEAIVEGAYKGSETTALNTSASTKSVTATENWKSYKNREKGYEISYPSTSFIRESASVTYVIDNVYYANQSEYPYISLSSYKTNLGNVDTWITNNKGIFIGDQSPAEVPGFNTRIEKNIGIYNTLYFEWESMGKIRSYVFIKNESIIVFTILGSNDPSLIKIAENIIASYK